MKNRQPNRSTVDSSKAVSSYTAFSPTDYINEYYREISSENDFLLRFYHDVFAKLPHGLTLLEVGGGPTVYQLFSASRRTTNIVFTDYLNLNLDLVQQWLQRTEPIDQWHSFAAFVAQLEAEDDQNQNLSATAIEERTRTAIQHIIECNFLSMQALEALQYTQFDVVSSSFCLECVSAIEDEFLNACNQAFTLVRPGGHLLLTTLKNSHQYVVGNRVFPSFPLDLEYLTELLTAHQFKIVEVRQSPAEHSQGYEGLIALLAQRQA